MELEIICDVIILVAAVLVAVTNIYKFFVNSGKGIKKTVEDVKQKEEKELNEKIDARIKEVVGPMIDQSATKLTNSFTGLLDKHLPTRLEQHDQVIKQEHLTEREQYTENIKDEVILEMQEKLSSIEQHDQQMTVFAEALKELMRERIMEIYRRNWTTRKLYTHERYELRKAYDSYKSIGGNSYIDEYYATMDAWETVPDEIL